MGSEMCIRDRKRTLAKDVQIEIRRVQFAVLPADTRVVYGAQGENWDATIPDMKKPPSMDDGTHWLACYVMLSRARTLEGLLILRPATYAELNRGAPQYLLDEVDRLLKLEKASTEDLKEYIENLPCQVPSEILELFRDNAESEDCLLYTSPSPRDLSTSRMPSSA